MVLFNYSTRELTAKIVYYGPGLCGKTTNLQYIHANLPDGVKGRMLSLATKTDRTLFFDFLPIDLGEIRGMKTRVQLYTVPGQVFYNETRKLVLKGADGIVFVADSQEQMMGANVESFRNLEENLRGHGMRLQETPHVIQFNKRDLPRLANIEELNSSINRYNAPFYESVATTGIGVQDTLKAVVKLVLLHLTRKYESKTDPRSASANAGARVPASPAAVPQGVEPEPARAMAARPPSWPHPPEQERPAPQRAPAARGVAPAAPSIQSVPVSDFETPLSRPSSIPGSPGLQPLGATGAARPSVPPPPDFRGRGEALAAPGAGGLAFDSEEIEDLVDEVGELGEAPLQADDVDWAPPAQEKRDDGPFARRPAARPAPAPSFPPFAAEAPPPAPAAQVAPAPARDEAIGISDEIPIEILEEDKVETTAWPPPAMARPVRPGAKEPQFEVDLGFDPAWQPEAIGAAPAEPADEIELPGDDAIVLEPIEAAPAGEAEAEEAREAAEEPVETLEEPTPIPVRHTEAAPPEEDAETVVLEEIARGDQLFEDPGLEVARLTAGEARELVVPVEIVEGSAVRRFKLSLRLRLDPLD